MVIFKLFGIAILFILSIISFEISFMYLIKAFKRPTGSRNFIFNESTGKIE